MVVLTRSSSRAASEVDHNTAGRVAEEEVVGQDEDWEELCRRVWEVVRGWRRGEIVARIARREAFTKAKEGMKPGWC